MSTPDVWFDEAEITWSRPRAAAAVAVPPRRSRRPGAGVVLALLAVIAAAGTLAWVDLDRDGAPRSAPPLNVPDDGTRAASPAPAATLDAIAHCESRGDPTAVSADGRYRGKYQFDLATWRSIGGTGDPALAPEREQDRRARALAAERGTAPWPVCSAAAGG